MTITLVVGASFLLGAVVSRLLDRIEQTFQAKRDDRRFAATWASRNGVNK